MKGWGGKNMLYLPSTPLLLPASQHQLVLFVVIKDRPKYCMAVQNIRKYLYSSD
jgi:hypothetical protein